MSSPEPLVFVIDDDAGRAHLDTAPAEKSVENGGIASLTHFRDWCRPKPHLSSGFSSRKSAFATTGEFTLFPKMP
jgi:hypothetical protein